MPSGISLNEFVYSLGKVELSGFAAERVSLVEFKENLEMCPDFLNVDFPSKNWLMAKDIEFNINFEYGKKN